MNKEDDIKEDFCGACIAMPLALAGAAGTGVAGKGKHGKNKKYILYIGITITIISFIVGLYFLMKCKDCR